MTESKPAGNVDMISRQDAIDAMLGDKVQITDVIRAIGGVRDFEALNYTCDRHAEIIKALPPVQPKRGRWLKDGDAHYCSECGVGILEFGHGGEPIYFVEGYNRANRERCITTPGWCSYYMQFCPYCGADMRGGDNGKT